MNLRSKLLIAFLIVSSASTLALIAVAELSSGAFYEAHIRQMTGKYGAVDAMHEELRQGFSRALGNSLLVGLAVGLPSALVIGLWVSRRILEPVTQVSLASRRIASGAYNERIRNVQTDELGRLIEDFNLMAAALESVESRRIELIGNVAHELRTPLSGLQGYAEGLADGLFDPEQASDSIRREVARLKRVVDDLSEVSKIESGALELRLEHFDLVSLVLELRERYEPMFEAADSKLEFQKPALAVIVNADRDRTAQIVVNLLSNALKYAPEGIVILGVTRGQRTAQLEVRDAGQGIAAEHLPHIFERFYRADSSRSPASGGSGVGLTISKHLAEAMHGSLEVQSVVGQGSSFILKLLL
jgi:signal transduction histidine kinase